jgi:hypothetical protein
VFEILEVLKVEDCYPNDYVGDGCIFKKKFFKIKIIEKLLKIVNITRNLEWSNHFMY